jgi:soluble lytic murein transglycosylase-like protein
MRWQWIAAMVGGAIVIAGMLASGAADALVDAVSTAMGLSEEQNDCRKAIRRVALAHGIDPDWIDAIAKQESNWDPNAVNKTGADGARGGSYGCLQLSVATAQSAGFDGDPEDLFDPTTVAEYFCKIQASRPGGTADSLEDMCAYWNAGKVTASDPRLPASTKNDYIPRVLANYEKIQDAENESGEA